MPLPEAIIISRKYLSRFFGSDIHNTLVDENNGSFTLSNSISLFNTSDKKGTYVLWNFPVNTNLLDVWSKYPIYFSFRIKLKANDEISELSIKLFKEDNKTATNSSTIPTEPLLRVEWSNESTGNVIVRKHAQPHWHIHSYTIVDKLEGINPQERKIFLELLSSQESSENSFSILTDMEQLGENSNQEDVKEVTIDKGIPSFKFHLAMLAEWDKRLESKHDKQLTNEVLEQWLPRCLLYIQEQVEYILERMKG